MARREFNVGLLLALVAVMWTRSLAQPNCTPTIMSLAPCLGFIAGNSSTPSSSCCAQLATVVQTQARCLCTVLNGAPQLPFVVNQTQALTLPGACKIQAPPLSQCNAAGGPGSPQGAPAPASSTTPSAAAAPAAPTNPTPTTPTTPTTASPTTPSTSGSGSKTVPTTGQTSSAECSTSFAALILFALFMASALSTF